MKFLIEIEIISENYSLSIRIQEALVLSLKKKISLLSNFTFINFKSGFWLILIRKKTVLFNALNSLKPYALIRYWKIAWNKKYIVFSFIQFYAYINWEKVDSIENLNIKPLNFATNFATAVINSWEYNFVIWW
jgi:hypothetical protein